MALEKVSTTFYDLVLMSIRMPVMNGLESCWRIRRFNRNLPVIGMADRALPSNTRKALEAGMNGRIRKPLKAEELTRALEDAFSGQKRETGKEQTDGT